MVQNKSVVLNNSYRNNSELNTLSGDQFRIDYVKCFKDSGESYLKEVGKTDLQALYDSHLSECDMSSILDAINLYGKPVVSFEEGVEDLTIIQNSSPEDRLNSIKNYDSNLKLYEEKMKELEAQIESLKNNNEVSKDE